jgi:malate dehydrogenase
VAERFGVSPARVSAITLGSHGETMVPVPSLALVEGRPLRELLSEEEIGALVRRTRDAGAEIVTLHGTGSAYYAPAAAAEVMVQAVAKDTGDVLPASVLVDGAYGIEGVYVGVPARVGRIGVQEIVELPLADDELAALRTAADTVRVRQAEVANLA